MRRNTFLSSFFSIAMLAVLAQAPAQAQQTGGKLTVEADNSLEWRQQQKQYIASGNAVATQDDITMKADVITAGYEDDATAAEPDSVTITRIHGTSNAELQKGGFTATADDIDYDLKADRATLTGGTPTVIGPGDKITAKRSIIYDRSERRITAEGAAVVTLSNGQRLQGETIIAILNKAEDDFSFIQAIGDAEVFSPKANGTREARADELEYSKSTGIATLVGSVRLIDAGNTMKGDRAEINTTTGISTMTSTGGRVGGVFTATQ